MLYLLLGLVAGALYWLNNAWSFWEPFRALNPVYIHLLVVGWITQLIYGVMYWMFPIISRTELRGDARPAWAALVALNVGLILRAVAEPWRVLDPNAVNQAGVILSAIFQVAAGYLIVLVCWPRVREKPGK
ncbi:MAG: hypothetical protein K8I30_17050 [Anaerolineae bacterium]|nr:hypothetical protein [Anaerolineae bacterium]